MRRLVNTNPGLIPMILSTLLMKRKEPCSAVKVGILKTV